MKPFDVQFADPSPESPDPMSAAKVPLSEVRFLDSGVWEPGMANAYRQHYSERDGFSLTYDRESGEVMIINKKGQHRAVHIGRVSDYVYKVAPVNPFASESEAAKARALKAVQ